MPPTAATTSAPNRNGKNADNTTPPALVPFIRASAEHREPAGIDVSRALTSSEQSLGTFDVPAYGYVRSIFLVVTATGGAGTSVTATEDAPFNVLTNISLTEPNGSVLQSFDTGFDLYLANKWGGYRWPGGADPKASPAFSAVDGSTGNFTFVLRIPVEINLRDALGSLPNQNAAATFKLKMNVAKVADVLGGTITTNPTVRVRAYLEAWDQPEAATGGAPNAQTPPALNTTQFWSSQTLNYSKGQQTLRLARVGNYIRNLVFVARNSAGERSGGQSDFPDPVTIYLDTRPLDIIEANNFANQMFERSGFGGAVGSAIPARDSANGLNNGVFVYDFDHEFDGGLGRENRDLWLPTLASTRLEIQGTFGNSGTLTVLTNDVAVTGQVFM